MCWEGRGGVGGRGVMGWGGGSEASWIAAVATAAGAKSVMILLILLGWLRQLCIVVKIETPSNVFVGRKHVRHQDDHNGSHHTRNTTATRILYRQRTKNVPPHWLFVNQSKEKSEILPHVLSQSKRSGGGKGVSAANTPSKQSGWMLSSRVVPGPVTKIDTCVAREKQRAHHRVRSGLIHSGRV